MNYIQEINAFYTQTETNPLSGSAATLWHALMHVNNRAHWIKEFSVAASVLCSKSGLPLSTLKRARTELSKKGYVIHTPRGTKAPIYQMVSLVEHRPGGFQNADVVAEEVEVVREETEQLQKNEVTRVEEEGVVGEIEDSESPNIVKLMIDNYRNGGTLADIGLGADRGGDQGVSQEVSRDTSPLNKQNKTKTNQTNNYSSDMENGLAYPFYEEKFGRASITIQDELTYWINRLGDNLVYEALKRTVESGKTSWRYTVGILKRWRKDGLVTVADVLRAEDNFRKRSYTRNNKFQENASYGGRYRHQGEDVVPDWFWKHQEEQRIKSERKRREMLYG